MEKLKYDKMFMQMALAAAEQSEAQNLKVGAVAVKDGNVIGIGMNGTPVGWHTNKCEDENGKTRQEVYHAEANMVAKITRSNNSSVGATCYVTHSPCIDCAKLLVQTGFIRVVFERSYKRVDGIRFLEDCGINCKWIDTQ